MRHGKRGAAAVLAALMLAPAGSGCAESAAAEVYEVSYVNTAGTCLVEEEYTPENEGGTELLTELLERMRAPQAEGSCRSAIPEDLEIRDVALTGGSVVLDFGSGYYDMSAAEEILMRAAVVETLCRVPEVDTVTFTVENVALVDALGITVGTMDADTFIDGKDGGIMGAEPLTEEASETQSESLEILEPSVGADQSVGN